MLSNLSTSANLRGFLGNADHVADADYLEQSRVNEFIGRAMADTENGCDVIRGVCFALEHLFFAGRTGVHSIVLLVKLI